MTAKLQKLQMCGWNKKEKDFSKKKPSTQE